MLKLYTASAKKYYFFEEIITEKIKNNQFDFIALLPVNRAVRLLKRRLTDSAPAQTIIDVNIFTFNEILLKIYNRLPDSKRVIQGETQRLFISHILRTQKSVFNYFPVNQDIPESSVVKIADIIAELRRFGYSEDKFRTIELESSEKQEDFNHLLKRLEELLAPNLIDEPFALFTAAENLTRENFRRLYPQVTNIYISGYELFTPAMIRFLENTKDWLDIHLKLTYNAENSAAFKHVRDAWEKLNEIASEIITEKDPPPLARHLLSHESGVLLTAADTGIRYYAHKLKNRREEINFIAALAHQLNKRDHIPLHRIAITFANLERYVPIIRTIFAEHKLPYNLSTGFKLNQSPLIQLFLNVLKWIVSGFDSAKALELINNQFIAVENRAELIRLFKTFARYRIEYLSSRSLRELRKNIAAYDADGDQVRNIDRLFDFFKPFYDFPKSGNITQLRSAYISLLKKIGLLDWYKDDSEYLSEQDREKEFRAYNRFMKIFDKFVWSMTRIGNERTLSLKDFIRLLQSQVGSASYSLAEKTDYGVQINPRLEIQALSYDVLIIGGLLDGEFPRESVKDVFFNDSVRKKLGLIAAENLFDQDRFIFYSLIDSDARSVYLTYPEYEQDRILPPSTFISDFKEIFPELNEDPSFESRFLHTEDYYWTSLGKSILAGERDQAIQIMKTLINTGGERAAESLHKTLRHIEGQKLRGGGTTISPYEGGMSENSRIMNILREKFDNVVWSASRLEEYAFCPMHFFYNRILKIEEWPIIEEEFTPLERGNLLHTILFRFYSEIPEKDKPAQYKNRLTAIAQEEIDRLPYRGFFARLEKIRYCGGSGGNGFLSYFIDYDQQQINESGYRPAYFELSFGMRSDRNNCDPASISAPLTLEAGDKQIRLQGKIDRVDISDTGSALIFDYKTGTSAAGIKPQDIIDGLAFQIPLYMKILPQLISRYSADYGGYYIIKDKNKDNCRRHTLIADKESAPAGKPKQGYLPNKKLLNEEGNEYTLDDLLEISVKHALKCTEDIIKGNFRHSLFPEKDGCQKYCDYRKMCRKNPAKMKRIAETLSG